MSNVNTTSKATKGTSKGSQAPKGKGKGSEPQAPATPASIIAGLQPLEGSKVSPVGARCGSRIGLTHGLNLTAWYNMVFAAIKAGAPLTDLDVHNAVIAEYPLRGIYQSTGMYRSYYNGGKHGLGPVNPATGKPGPALGAARVLPYKGAVVQPVTGSQAHVAAPVIAPPVAPPPAQALGNPSKGKGKAKPKA